MGSVKEPIFKINPNFRLTTKYLSVRWHCVDSATLECEATIELPDHYVYLSRNIPELLVQYNNGVLDMVYSSNTDFSTKSIQKWLMELFRNIILNIAKQVLPERVRHWENLKGLKGTGVTVKRLRKNILGQCSFSNHITLQPFLVIFKQEWMDGVILHEIAHYKYKHHRKPFWDFLSELIGDDSKMAKVKDNIAMSPYYNYYLYLTKNK